MSIISAIRSMFHRPWNPPTSSYSARRIIGEQNLEPREPVVPADKLSTAEGTTAISGANVVGRLIEKAQGRLQRGIAALSAAFEGNLHALLDAELRATDPNTVKTLRKADLAADVLLDLKWRLNMRARMSWAFIVVSCYLAATDGLFLYSIYRDAFGVTTNDYSSWLAINAALLALLTPILVTLLSAIAGDRLSRNAARYTLAHSDEDDDGLGAKLTLITERKWRWRWQDWAVTGTLTGMVLGASVVFLLIGLYRFNLESAGQIGGVQLPVGVFSILLAALPIASTATAFMRKDMIREYLNEALAAGKKLRVAMDRGAKHITSTERALELAWLQLANLIHQIVAAGNMAIANVEQIIALAASQSAYRDIAIPLKDDVIGGGAAAGFAAASAKSDQYSNNDKRNEAARLAGTSLGATWSIPVIAQTSSTTWPQPAWITNGLVTALQALDAYRPNGAKSARMVEQLITVTRPPSKAEKPTVVSSGIDWDALSNTAGDGTGPFHFPAEGSAPDQRGEVPGTV